MYEEATRDDRLNKICKSILAEERERKENVHELHSIVEAINERLESVERNNEVINTRYNITESFINETKLSLKVQDYQIKGTMDRIMNQVNEYMKTSTEATQSLTKKCHFLTDWSDKLQSNLNENSTRVDELSKLLHDQINKYEKVCDQLVDLSAKKCEMSDLVAYKEDQAQKERALHQQIDQIDNLTCTCNNFMEKYMPLYVQRQISDFIEYLFTDRATRWRLNWYNEIKIPLLTAGIMFDNG